MPGMRDFKAKLKRNRQGRVRSAKREDRGMSVRSVDFVEKL